MEEIRGETYKEEEIIIRCKGIVAFLIGRRKPEPKKVYLKEK